MTIPPAPGAVRTGLIASLTAPGEEQATPDIATKTQVVARLNAGYGGCGVVSVSIGGTSMRALSDYAGSGPQLQQRPGHRRRPLAVPAGRAARFRRLGRQAYLTGRPAPRLRAAGSCRGAARERSRNSAYVSGARLGSYMP